MSRRALLPRPAASPTNGSEGVHEPDPAAARIFIGTALAIAQSIDPMLAQLLRRAAGRLGESGAEAGPWRGDRRQGLELCLRMLLYVRPEILDPDVGSPFDLSLRYIACELGQINGEVAGLSHH